MANDTAALGWNVSSSRAEFTPRLAEVAYFAFLLLIFVGLEPFAVRDAAVLTGAMRSSSGAGDAMRQIAFAGVFAAIVYAALREKGRQAVYVVPWVLAMLLGWCLLSAAWSDEAGVTLRRAVLEAVIVLSAMMSVSMLGASRSFQILRWVLALVLIANWLSIPLIHQAIHLPDDPEPTLVGDWRGLYFHKNIAGAVSAITAIVFFFSAWEKRRPLDAFLCVAAVAFTVMTRSKSSLALLPVALMGGAVYRFTWGRPIDRLIAIVLLGLVLVGGAAFVAIDQNALTHLFADPDEFTGRAEIWQAEFAFIRDHPYLGAGFGSFADTGALSPLYHYVASDWVNKVSHGHNAYLQLCVTIGGVGLVLAMVGLIVSPLIAFWQMGGWRVATLAPFFALFVFVILHNFLESDFLEGDNPAWVSFLLMLAGLRLAMAEKVFTTAAQP